MSAGRHRLPAGQSLLVEHRARQWSPTQTVPSAQSESKTHWFGGTSREVQPRPDQPARAASSTTHRARTEA